MARVRAILASLWIAARRNQKSLTSFSGNHLFYAGAAFLFLQDSEAFVFFAVIIGLVLFFPLTTDPLLKIPQDRLAVWPLTRREHWLLGIFSPLLNPMTWLLIALLVWKRLSPGFGRCWPACAQSDSSCPACGCVRPPFAGRACPISLGR
jgi:hypothetical protein